MNKIKVYQFCLLIDQVSSDRDWDEIREQVRCIILCMHNSLHTNTSGHDKNERCKIEANGKWENDSWVYTDR